MTTLTEFLLARITEDEAAARAVADENVGGAAVSLHLGDNAWDSEWPFADRFTPARVLAECAAKRRIVEQVERNVRDVDPGWCERILTHLAAVYADHPDYRAEWAL